MTIDNFLLFSLMFVPGFSYGSTRHFVVFIFIFRYAMYVFSVQRKVSFIRFISLIDGG